MRSVFTLRVACDQAYPGIIADIGRRVRSVHPASSVFHVRAPGVVIVQNYWKHWPCPFAQHGPGRKHERKVELEDDLCLDQEGVARLDELIGLKA